MMPISRSYEQACHGRQPVRHSLSRSVRSVGRAKRVVHVQVGQRGQLVCETTIIRLFFRVEAHVLQQQHLSWLKLLSSGPGNRPHAIASKAHARAIT
jgi:hypothetical protein